MVLILFSVEPVSLWEIILHHIAISGMFTYHVVNSRYIAYSALALFAEFNSVFLHGHKLMQMNKVPIDSWVFRIVVYINMVTCLICRFPSMSSLIIGLYTEYDRLSTTYAIMLALTTPIGAAVDLPFLQACKK